MNLRNKLFGNAAIYLGANILNAAIPFLLLPVLTRVLSPADYGTLAMFGLMLTVFGAFTGLSVHGAIGVRYFQLSKEELAQYVGACLGILVISTSLVALLVVVIGDWLSGLSGVPADWLLVAVALSGLQFLGNVRLSLLQAAGQAINYGAFQISQSFINATLSLVLILGLGMAWQGRVLGQVFSVAVFGFIALFWLRKDGFLRKPMRWHAQSADALKFGVPLIPHVIGGLLIVATDRFVIVQVLDVSMAGIFMVALQVGQVLAIFTESFNKAYAPWLTRKLVSPESQDKAQIVRGTYLYFILVIAMAGGLGLMAPLLMSFLVGEPFREAGPLVIYIGVGFALGGCYYMVTNYIFFQGKTQILALVTIISGLANVPLMIFLVRINGLEGAGQAFVLSNALSFFGTWWLAQKVHPMPWLRPFNESAV